MDEKPHTSALLNIIMNDFKSNMWIIAIKSFFFLFWSLLVFRALFRKIMRQLPKGLKRKLSSFESICESICRRTCTMGHKDTATNHNHPLLEESFLELFLVDNEPKIFLSKSHASTMQISWRGKLCVLLSSTMMLEANKEIRVQQIVQC